MSKRMRILLVGFLLALMTANLGGVIYSMLLPPKGSYDGWTGRWDGNGEPRVTSIDSNGPAAALRVGDEIVAINGVKVKENPGILDFNRGVPPGTREIMTIRRSDVLLDIEFKTAPYKWRKQFNPLALVSLLFLLTGWIVFLLRPDDKQAYLLALMLGTLTGLMGSGPANLPPWLTAIVGLARTFGTLFLPVFLHFFLIFPGKSPLLRRWSRLEYWLYLPYLLVILPAFAPGRMSGYWSLWLSQFWGFRLITTAGLALAVIYLAAGLFCLLINYQAANQSAKRRLRVAMSGSAAGFFNLFLMLIGESTGLQERMPGLWWWLDLALFITLPLVPLSFVYAIIRHQVIPISLIIRRGVRYMLVSRGSILLEAIVVFLTVTALLTYVFNRFKPPAIVIGIVSATIGILVWKVESWLHGKYLAPVIDRRFFRESYDSHQIMAELTSELRAVSNLPQLLELVSNKIHSALKTENVTIFLRDRQSGDYLSGYSCLYSSGDGKPVVCDQQNRLPSYSAIIETLANAGHPVEIEDGVPDFARNNGYRASGLERQTSRELKSSLLMPLATKEGMLGIVSLGPRLGDLPYSRDDKNMLMSVGGPATFAIENAQLVERMIEEARRREEIEAENQQRAKELEEARQLQISMLPKTIPQLPHLDIAAYMKTATEVGGDYYDFHLSDNGELTIVVGDATGHGLKAGTVVTATKSLFNHLAETADVTELFHHSSRALKLMNMRSLFMAMTVARITGDTLTLSSAGMPPVLIYRAATGQVEEVQLTGVPLGSVISYRYRQQQFKLSSGDVIVLMSDGFPERFNSSGEMIGYEQAKRSLAESAAKTARAIIERYLQDAEVWADSYPQNDDVTFVVIKVR